MITMLAGSRVTSPMIAASTPAGCGTHRREHGVGVLRRNDGDQLALIRQIQRIEAEDLARAAHWIAYRYGALADMDANAGGVGEFVQYGRNTTTRCVAQASYGGADGQHGGDQAVERLAVAGHVSLQRELIARDQDRDAVVAERAA